MQPAPKQGAAEPVPSLPTGTAEPAENAPSGTPQQATPEQNRGGEQRAGSGAENRATPAQPNGAGQPATPAQPAQGNATRAHGEPVRGTRLHQAAETVEATIRLAAQRGSGHARIALRPAELGGIEIHLRHTSAGLTATVTAEAPEAAQVLQQAAAELRRSLEDQGLQILRLDVGVAQDHRAGHGAGTAGDDGARRGPAGDEEAADGLVGDDGEPLEAETVQLPNGVLINVIA